MIGLALVPLIESYALKDNARRDQQAHTVWIHNKMWKGTYGMVAVMVNGQERTNGGSYATHGFHVDVFSDITTFNLSFSVEASSEKDKDRGPFTNDKDHEWKFTGSIDNWDIEEMA